MSYLGQPQILLAKKECAGLTISGIAEGAGITAGLMYQYFPNKSAIIHALGEHYITKVHQEIAVTFEKPPQNRNEFWELTASLFNYYFDMQTNDPVMRDIWMGVSVDKQMQDLDWQDTTQNVEILFEASHSLFPTAMHSELKVFVLLLLQFG